MHFQIDHDDVKQFTTLSKSIYDQGKLAIKHAPLPQHNLTKNSP